MALISLRFAQSRDMSLRPHQLFLALLIAYALQSALLTIRWGYGVQEAGTIAALLAPVLPVLAYLSYASLTHRLRGRRLLPLLVIPLNWAALWLSAKWADPIILMTYLGFGALLIRIAWQGPDRLTFTPLQSARDLVSAIWLTAGTLIASGLTDIYVIVDFIRTDGQNVGLVVTVVQTIFVLVIGASAALGRAAQPEPEEPSTASPPGTDEDKAILDQIDTLFTNEALHRDEELSLRRIARKLGVPDRKVSNAVNRIDGQSVSQFVNSYRIKDACVLLHETNASILSVSLTVGFASKSNFNREFTRVTGMTPSKWRSSGPNAV